MGPQTSTDPKAFQIPVQPNTGEYFDRSLQAIQDIDPMTVPLTDEERVAYENIVSISPVDEARNAAVATEEYFMEHGTKAVNAPYVARKFGEMVNPNWVEGQLPPEAAAYFDTAAPKEFSKPNSYVDALSENDLFQQAAYDMAVSTSSYSEKNISSERVPTPREIAGLSKAVVAWRQNALGSQSKDTINTLRTK